MQRWGPSGKGFHPVESLDWDRIAKGTRGRGRLRKEAGAGRKGPAWEAEGRVLGGLSKQRDAPFPYLRPPISSSWQLTFFAIPCVMSSLSLERNSLARRAGGGGGVEPKCLLSPPKPRSHVHPLPGSENPLCRRLSASAPGRLRVVDFESQSSPAEQASTPRAFRSLRLRNFVSRPLFYLCSRQRRGLSRTNEQA